jgi:hypothetical protein
MFDVSWPNRFFKPATPGVTGSPVADNPSCRNCFDVNAASFFARRSAVFCNASSTA